MVHHLPRAMKWQTPRLVGRPMSSRLVRPQWSAMLHSASPPGLLRLTVGAIRRPARAGAWALRVWSARDRPMPPATSHVIPSICPCALSNPMHSLALHSDANAYANAMHSHAMRPRAKAIPNAIHSHTLPSEANAFPHAILPHPLHSDANANAIAIHSHAMHFRGRTLRRRSLPGQHNTNPNVDAIRSHVSQSAANANPKALHSHAVFSDANTNLNALHSARPPHHHGKTLGPGNTGHL